MFAFMRNVEPITKLVIPLTIMTAVTIVIIAMAESERC